MDYVEVLLLNATTRQFRKKEWNENTKFSSMDSDSEWAQVGPVLLSLQFCHKTDQDIMVHSWHRCGL